MLYLNYKVLLFTLYVDIMWKHDGVITEMDDSFGGFNRPPCLPIHSGGPYD